MFGTILISIATLMHFYVCWRTSSVPFIKQNISRKALIVTGILLWAVLFLTRVFGHHGTGILVAYTNRFNNIGGRIRTLHSQYRENPDDLIISGQIESLRKRVYLI